MLVRRFEERAPRLNTAPLFSDRRSTEPVQFCLRSADERGGVTLNDVNDFLTENCSSQSRNLALTGLSVPSMFDSSKGCSKSLLVAKHVPGLSDVFWCWSHPRTGNPPDHKRLIQRPFKTSTVGVLHGSWPRSRPKSGRHVTNRIKSTAHCPTCTSTWVLTGCLILLL